MDKNVRLFMEKGALEGATVWKAIFYAGQDDSVHRFDVVRETEDQWPPVTVATFVAKSTKELCTKAVEAGCKVLIMAGKEIDKLFE